MSSSTLANALVEAQQKMPTLTKTAKAVYGKYVTLDKVIEATRPILNAHGLAIVQFPAVSELGAPVLRTTLIHGATGEQITADAPLFLDQQNMQKLGAAITYARRYAWASACGIATDEDDDAQSVSPRTSSAARTDGNRGSAADTGQRSSSPQAAGPDDPGSFVVNFSKNYKGRGLTLAQIYYDENDQGFVKWIAEKSTFEDAKQAAVAYLVNPTAPGDTPGHGQGEDIPFAPTITGYGL